MTELTVSELMEAVMVSNDVKLALVPTIVLTCMELRLASENVRLLAVRFPTFNELIDPFSATNVPDMKLDALATTESATNVLTVSELVIAVANTTSPADRELISKELIIPLLKVRSRADRVLTVRELMLTSAIEALFVRSELTARELREPYSKFMSKTLRVLTTRLLMAAFEDVRLLTEAVSMNATLVVRVLAINVLVLTNSPKIAPLIVLMVRELIVAFEDVRLLTEAVSMNATLVVRVLAIKVLVLTNSPKIAPLIVLMVRELMTASLRARERNVSELTLKELTSSLLNIP